jgi:hypothetical protein
MSLHYQENWGPCYAGSELVVTSVGRSHRVASLWVWITQQHTGGKALRLWTGLSSSGGKGSSSWRGGLIVKVSQFSTRLLPPEPMLWAAWPCSVAAADMGPMAHPLTVSRLSDLLWPAQCGRS